MVISAVALPPASSFGCLTGDAHPIPWPSLKFYALKVILNKKVSQKLNQQSEYDILTH